MPVTKARLTAIYRPTDCRTNSKKYKISREKRDVVDDVLSFLAVCIAWACVWFAIRKKVKARLTKVNRENLFLSSSSLLTPTCVNVPCNYSKYFSQQKGTHFLLFFYCPNNWPKRFVGFFLNENYKRGRSWLSEKICFRTHLKLNTYSETRWGGSKKNPCCFVGQITCWSRSCPGWIWLMVVKIITSFVFYFTQIILMISRFAI